MSLDIYIFQIFPSPKKSRDEKFQNKKKSLVISVTSTLSFPNPRLSTPVSGRA